MKTLLKVLVFILLSTPLFAANYWTGNGSDDFWTNPDNWSGTYPDTSNQLKLQGDGEIIEVIPGDTIQTNRAIFIDGTSVSGGLDDTTTTINMTGGSVTCSSYFRVGYFGTSSTEPNEGAVLNLSGDAYFQTGTFQLGWRNNALVNVNITDTSRLYVTGTSPGFTFPASTVTNAKARVNITDNGVLELNSLAMTVGEDGIIDIYNDGVLKVKGDVKSSVLDSLITADQILVDGGEGIPTILYDGTWTWVMDPNNMMLTKVNTPTPADGSATYTIIDLSWVPGSATNTWDLYLGTDPENLSLLQSGLSSPEYTLSCLDFETEYFWRVDEFTGSVTNTGDVWSFTTRTYTELYWFEYAVEPNDFEAEWAADNGSISLSHDPARGTASMALTYDNSISPYLSSASSLTFPYDGDLTCTNGVAMSIWVYGDAGNSDETVFASLSDGTNTATTVLNDPAVTTTAEWTTWNIDMRDFTDDNPSLDMGNVTSMTIGIGDPDNPSAGGSGTVYIDNINMHPVRCLNRPATDLTGDCITDVADLAEMASEWLSNGNFPIL